MASRSTFKPARSWAARVALGAYVLAMPVAAWLSIGQFILPARLNTWLLTMISGAEYATTFGPQLHGTTVFLFHVAPSIAFVFLVPVQFSDTIRRRSLKAHRRAGRVFALSSATIGVTAFIISWRYPFAGYAESLTSSVSAAYFLLTLERAVRAARTHDVNAHRAWMIRHVATGYLVVTMRFLQPVLLRLTEFSLADLFVPISVASFVVNQLLAEAWIRSFRVPRKPQVKPTWARELDVPAA